MKTTQQHHGSKSWRRSSSAVRDAVGNAVGSTVGSTMSLLGVLCCAVPLASFGCSNECGDDGAPSSIFCSVDLSDATGPNGCTPTASSESTAVLCSDGLDNDCNGLTDASDPGCDGIDPGVCIPDASIEHTDAHCADGIDNDCNGLTDASDPGCNQDGTGTCEPAGDAENTQELCTDGLDNDCNGQIDTDDPGCDDDAICEPTASIEHTDAHCADGIDNDCNGLADASDPGCNQDGTGTCEPAGDAENTQELCTDGLDNDCNGQIDTDDPGCEGLDEDRDNDGWCPIGPDSNGDGQCTDDDEQGVGDCNDESRWQNPELPEICDGGLDNDCNPETTETNEDGGACEKAQDHDCYLRFRHDHDASEEAAYMICLDHMDWDDAGRVCSKVGMALTRIDDDGENAWIWNAFHDIVRGDARGFGEHGNHNSFSFGTDRDDAKWDNKGSYWIGARDERGDDEWLSPDGHYLDPEPVAYTRWAPGEPDDHDAPRCGRVLHLRDHELNGKWFDKECSAEGYKLVCERF